MVKSITMIDYIAMSKIARYAMLAVTLLLLSGCLGGTVAQQIARSIATSIADKTIANAMDVNEDAETKSRQHITLQDREPSELSMILMTSRFRDHPIDALTVMSSPAENPVLTLQVAPLVRVQLFNLIIGDERKSIIENAISIGTLNLSDHREQDSWFVASGIIEENNEHIIFLIPPDIGKLASGTIAIVELANAGNLSIARYTVGDHKVLQAMDQSTHFSWQ